MIKRTLMAAIVCMWSGAGRADWTTKVEGPDVFGNTKVHAIAASNINESLVIQCDQKDDLHIALLFRKKEFDKLPTVPAELLVQADNGQPVKLSAVLRTWNDNYGGIVAEGSSAELVAILRTIALARGKINLGAVVNGNQICASFGSQGSRAAMEKAIKSCKLEELEKKA